MSVDSKREALKILGLSGEPDREEIVKAFEKKLFETHPDTKERYEKSESSFQLTVDRVLEARKLLLEGISDSQIAEDPEGYYLYRKANQIYADSLDRYFQVRKHYSFLNRDHPAEVQFRKSLLEARAIFAQVLDRYPAGKWMIDSVERIARINNWLGTESNTA